MSRVVLLLEEYSMKVLLDGLARFTERARRYAGSDRVPGTRGVVPRRPQRSSPSVRG